MLLQNALKQVDLNRLVDICTSDLPNTKAAIEYRKKLYEYIVGLCNMPVVESNELLYVRKVHDVDEDYYDASVLHEWKLTTLKQSYDNMQTFVSEKRQDEAYKMFSDDYQAFDKLFYTPEAYAFELTPTNQVLGYHIYLDFYNEEEQYQVLKAIIDELTFCGFEDDGKEKTLNSLRESMKEVDEILKLPQEEQDKHFHTVKEIFPDYQGPTEEDRIIARNNMVDETFRKIDFLYHYLTEYINK